MTKQMEQPVRHRLRRCEGCGTSFVDCDEDAEFCIVCQAAEKPTAPLEIGFAAPHSNAALDPATAEAASPTAIEQSPLPMRQDESSALGLPKKIVWSTPAFQVGWDDAEYPVQSDDSQDSLPVNKLPMRSNKRMALALVAGVSVLMLISRLDAPSVELVWRDRAKANSADSKPAHPVPAPASAASEQPAQEAHSKELPLGDDRSR